MLKQAAIIESTNAAPVIYDVNGNIVPDSGATVTVGGTTNLKITPNVTQTDENGNTVNITSGITYEASASGSAASVSVDQNGNITITGNDIGNCDITVNILYNGAVIGTQKVKLNVKELTKDDILQNATWQRSSEHLEVFGVSSSGNQVTSYNFAELYNNNAVIQLHTGDTDGDWNQFKAFDLVYGRLSDLLGFILEALNAAGLDYTRLRAAFDTVRSDFGNTDNWKADKQEIDGANRAKFCAGKIQSGTYPQDTVVKFHEEKKGKGDKVCYMVSFRGLVDAMLEAYGI